jgi:hypothetical protein
LTFKKINSLSPLGAEKNSLLPLGAEKNSLSPLGVKKKFVASYSSYQVKENRVTIPSWHTSSFYAIRHPKIA